MLFYAPFHLKRKTKDADLYLSDLINSVPSYSFFKHQLYDIEKAAISEDKLLNYLSLLKKKSRTNNT